MIKTANKTKSAIGSALFALGLFAAAGAIQLPATQPAMAESGVIHLTSSSQAKLVKVVRAKPKTIRMDRSFSEIVVGDPSVATVSPLTDRSFYVIGSKPGTTGIAIYDQENNIVGVMDIEVRANTKELNTTLKQALPGSNVKATSARGGIVLKGKAKSAVAAARAREIASKFDKNLVDTVEVKGSQQVQLQVRFIEAQRAKNKELGITVRGSRVTGSSVSQASGGAPFPGGGLLPGLLSGAVPFGDFFTSIIEGGTSVDVAIRALEDKGIARRLAEPNLVALSGDTASFLAGGEFPIPIAGGDGEITVTFKQFGVGLQFTPTVLENGLINLKLAPEVSDIDNANAVTLAGGISVPAVTVRRAETTLELRDGQSFVLAGLLQSNSSFNKAQLPWLADVPILGALFRSTSFQKNETDLVIVVTPRLVKPVRPGDELATPLDSTVPPTEGELFANGTLEVSKARLRQLADSEEGVLRSGHVIDLE